MNPKSPAHIARHSVGESGVTEAITDFASRIGRQVGLMQHSPGRDTFGWEMIADEFLDYVGALSLTDPGLRGKDAEAALRSAAAAALGVVTVGVYRWESVSVFIDYVNFGLTYGSADDPEVSLDETDWLRALHLAVICDSYATEAVTFGETAGSLPSGAGEPLWVRAAVGQAYGLLTYLRGYDLEDRYGAEPRTRAEAAGRIDVLLSELAADGNRNLGRVAGLTAVHALLTGDENAFGDALARLLTAHRAVVGASAAPRNLLPLDAIALAALAFRREGWPPAVESGYLPAALVTGVRTEGPRVGPYGRDKRAAAVAELAGAGVFTVTRPAFAWTDTRDDGVYDRLTERKLAEFEDPDADLRLIARMLPSGIRQQVLRFQSRAAHDPEGTDPRQLEALILAAELAVAACATSAPGDGESGGGGGDGVEVTIGGRALTLPRVGPQPDRMVTGWTHAVGAALVAGAREQLEPLLAVDPAVFGTVRTASATATYRAALHDHLRGADARPAVDRALAARERALGLDSDEPCPPAVLLSQLVAGDAEGFALALVDALEEHRDHYGVGDRSEGVDAAAGLDVLALACRARALGMPVPVASAYLPEALLALH
ncbi:immunity 49 family protein [Streptomyces albireticuli]|uniref:immunity 49 family protein n=1 Tax=Streptomyces albireticuli TaxID=1940 RepID=UPI0036A46300